MDLFYFYLNMFARRMIWDRGTKMLSYKSLKGILDNEHFEKWGFSAKDNSGTTPTKVRMYDGPLQQHIPSAGWHFSYMGGKEMVKTKVVSICEGVESFTDEEYEKLMKKILFGKRKKHLPVKFDKNFPQYLLDNKEKYSHLIYEKNCVDIKWVKLFTKAELGFNELFRRIFYVKNLKENNKKIGYRIGIFGFEFVLKTKNRVSRF